MILDECNLPRIGRPVEAGEIGKALERIDPAA